MMSDAFRRWAAFLVRHRVATIAVLSVISAFLAVGVLRLRLEVDPDASLPPEHEAIRALQELNQRFGDKNLVVIGLFPRDGDAFTPEFLAKFAEVSRTIEALPGVIHPLFQSIAAPAISHVVASDDGIDVVPLLGGAPRSQAEADMVRDRVFANPSFVGTLASERGDALAMYVTFDPTDELPSWELLYARVRSELEAVHDDTFDFAMSGPVVLVGALGVESSKLAAFLPLSILLIGLIHYHAFRTLQAIFLPLLTALLAVVWAVGLMGLLDVPLDPFTTTTPILILAVGAGHAVQILKRYYEEYARLGDSHAAVIESLAHVGPVMLAAGTIAAVALLSLSGSDLATLRTFGLFGALGIASTLVIELTLIPAVRAALPPPAAQEVAREARHTLLDGWLARLCDTVLGDGTRRILLGAAVVLVVCLGLATRVHVDTSFKRHFAPGTSVYDEDDRLNASFAGTSTLVFLVEAPEGGSILSPEGIRSIDAFERAMEQQPGVGKAFSIVDTVGLLRRALENDPDAPLPETTALAKQILLLYEAGGGSVTTEITPDDRIAKVVVLLRDDSTQYGTERIAASRALLDDLLPPGYEARIAGTLASSAALTEVVVEGKLAHILQVAGVTFVVASLLLQSLLAGLLVVVPVLLAVAVDFGVMGTLGLPLDVVTAPVTALGIGIGADYAAYFLFRLREELEREETFADAMRSTFETSGKAIVFVASAITVGYAALCVSSFSVHRQIGGLVAVAMFAAALASLTVLPSLARLAYESRFRRALVGRILERPENRA